MTRTDLWSALVLIPLLLASLLGFAVYAPLDNLPYAWALALAVVVQAAVLGGSPAVRRGWWAMMGRTARRQRPGSPGLTGVAVVVYSAAALLVLWVICGGLLLATNALGDAGPPQVHHVRVSSLSRSTGSRSGPSYHAVVESWRPGRREERLRLRRTQYEQLAATGRRVVVVTGPGALGWEWVRSIQVEGGG